MKALSICYGCVHTVGHIGEVVEREDGQAPASDFSSRRNIRHNLLVSSTGLGQPAPGAVFKEVLWYLALPVLSFP